ncbi:cell division protein FtsI/penicillin-binding protein 2 [Alkalihalobacillus xiaoxiensis]|uniref:serine-type D-Ala-D-Ala carboxypeptidase n=1 Tax=Shouchella xiaoxiensis TaxID=766895 RepID=A0ABS2SSZ2_9BACI|nr:penicillin-binding protein 2 [Shouchella xiaoxiensis]MBM7838136.1 cell division protein FtsI/penicillin-binding protein 2 [Shouchella xiaoxiensis]
MVDSKNQKSQQLSLRLNILFVFVFILFSALILRLGVVQIVNGEDYEEELTHVSNQTALIDAPRGKMFDAYNNVVVDNSLEISVTYTNPGSHKTSEMIELAELLSEYIEVDTENLRTRDLQEYYYTILKPEERKALIEDIEYDEDDETTEYQRMIAQISEEMVSGYSAEEEQVIAIFSHMLRGSSGSPQRIKQSITTEEAHLLSEHLDRLPYIDLQRDSSREYVYGNTLKSLFGRVGSIPSETVDQYLTKGYKRSDLIGVSNLEGNYEEVLRGQKAEISRTRTREGAGPMEQEVEEKPGSRGNDLVLSIDMEYQQLADEILETHVTRNRGIFERDASAYAVVMNPKTGDVLAMSGYQDIVGGNTDFNPLGTVNNVYETGSAIKAASVLVGLETGVVNPGTVVNDRPLEFRGTPTKRSVVNMGRVDMGAAMERSSNIYMFEIAMRMANYEYDNSLTKGQRTLFTEAKANEVLDKTRYYFNQFGLGTETGIDLPREETGLSPLTVVEPGNSLDFMIGQYDTYSTMQLAQYISTIANDGVRMRPRLVQEILEPTTNGEEKIVIQSNPPEVLNKIDMSEEHINFVQSTLRRVVTGQRGTARNIKTDVPIAAKTGTSQSKITIGEGDNRRQVDVNNLSFVGYAPYDDPEIAFAVITPSAARVPTGQATSKISELISQELVNSYFELKENRSGPQSVDSVIDEVDLFDE